MKALVIGGTGPTGPFIVDGLLARGYEATIYHRGTHEIEFSGPVEHIHGDPFSRDNLERDLAPRRWDIVISNYGRLRYIAQVLAGRTPRFIGITSPGGYLGFRDAAHNPDGLAVPIREDATLIEDRNIDNFGFLIADTERQLMAAHQRGDYQVTVLRYPRVYGPRQLIPDMWPIVKRAIDRRPHIVVPGDGLRIRAMGYAENMAYTVLLAVDKPQAAGQIYNVADERYLTLKERANMIAKFVGHEWEVVEVQHPWAEALACAYAGPEYHTMLDISKIKGELDYRDAVTAEEGVRRTVAWLVENHGTVITERAAKVLGDSYDYAFEDRFIAAYREHMDALSAAFPTPPPPPVYEYLYRE
ncbi:MAG: NAD-dependent epimerase/dehydratase family protein [Dehalococcoidia bacterium]|nr:NAD-dependent epimerase/dehydratase family protein [Dehalococcoidia bacterium]MDP6511228.1 NAD-dependent epimerase/dehydratase family protein [Dehalococcoidia bacterium]